MRSSSMASEALAVQTRYSTGAMQIMNGRVFLIGAGPGDPNLLTIRGAQLLRNSDVVLYDGLCNPEILAHAPQALQVCVGKHGQTRIWKQEEIIKEMIRYASEGKTVSRLKGGDPAVFARTAEEIDALSQAGIAFEIVPGITAALAAGSFTGIPVTHRKLSSAVALVTGHEEQGKTDSSLDWEALARFPGTLVIYMGVTTSKTWTENLINSGLAPETSVAIIRRCSLPDQQVLRCSLQEIPQMLGTGSRIRPPVIVIIGAVSELEPNDLQQFTNRRPLSGQTVLVTRPIDQAASLAIPLQDLGANVIIQPMIKISEPRDWSEVDQAIDNIERWDAIVFCSQNGVKHFSARLHEKNLDCRSLAGRKIAAVGSKTKEALLNQGIVADFVPEKFNSECLGESLSRFAINAQILIVRASRGNNRIAELLEHAGAAVTQVTAYEHQDVRPNSDELTNKMLRGEIDWVTAMSSETVRNLIRCFGKSLEKTRLATISPTTSSVARTAGLNVHAEANPYTSQALVQAILEAVK